MGTTSTGLRYPEGSDSIRDGALAIQHLAEDVDDALSSSAALPLLPVYSDFTASPNGALAAVQSGQAIASFGNTPLAVSSGVVTHTPAAGVNKAGYWEVDAGAPVTRASMLVEWVAGTPGAAVIVLPSTPWATSFGSDAAVHLVMYGNGIWHCSKFASGAETIYIDSDAAVGSTPAAGRFRDVRGTGPVLVTIEINPVRGTVTFILPGLACRVTTSLVAGAAGHTVVYELFEGIGSSMNAPKIHALSADTAPGTFGGRAREAASMILTAAPDPISVSLPSIVQYMPAVANDQNTPTAMGDVVAGTTQITFVAPSTGKGILELSGYLEQFTGATLWQVNQTSPGIGVPTGGLQRVQGTAGEGIRTMRVPLTGLAAGATYTYKWQHLQTIAFSAGTAGSRLRFDSGGGRGGHMIFYPSR